MGFNRDSINGQHFCSGIKCFYSVGDYGQAIHSEATITLKNHVGGGQILYGPNQGDIQRSSGGGLVVGQRSDPADNCGGQRGTGYGARWERLHLIGVGAGRLYKRDYSLFNTVMGSHGLNSAMIPFEGVVGWVIGENRKHIYSIGALTKRLKLEKKVSGKHIEYTEGDVAQEIIQSVSYESTNENIWINFTQKSVCPIVSALTQGQQVDHEPGIPDKWKLSTENQNQLYSRIQLLDAEIRAYQEAFNRGDLTVWDRGGIPRCT